MNLGPFVALTSILVACSGCDHFLHVKGYSLAGNAPDFEVTNSDDVGLKRRIPEAERLSGVKFLLVSTRSGEIREPYSDGMPRSDTNGWFEAFWLDPQEDEQLRAEREGFEPLSIPVPKLLELGNKEGTVVILRLSRKPK